MSARILVVDDQPLNVKLLEAMLAAEYYTVLTAADGPEALEVTKDERPDMILLDVMMPGMDGYEVCKRIKADPELNHIPIVMVTALDATADRIRGIEAGADDFLTKPINDVALFARVRSLLRMKLALDELRLRDNISIQLGAADDSGAGEDIGAGGRILVVENDSLDRKLIEGVLAENNHVSSVTSGEEAMAALTEPFDLIIVSVTLGEADGLRVCSQIRSRDDTRNVSLLMLIDADDIHHLAKGLELGVNDSLYKPIDRNELIARTRNQIRHFRSQERLRGNYHQSVSMAITDSLTGLYNRYYLDSHLAALLKRSRADDRPLAAAVIDIDFFKKVNDTYGHSAGDQVLREMAERLENSIRASDLVARLGGEEFVLVMSDTDMDTARAVTARICREIEAVPFAPSHINGGLRVTASIGVAIVDHRDKTPEDLIKRADEALYEAKNNGRNQVIAAVG